MANEGSTSVVFHGGLFWVQTLKKCWTTISKKWSHSSEERSDAYKKDFQFLLLPFVCTVLVWEWFIEHLSHQWGSVSKRTENKPDPWWCNIPGILETTPWIPKLFMATWPNSGQCLCLPISVKMHSLSWNTHSSWLNIFHILENT